MSKGLKITLAVGGGIVWLFLLGAMFSDEAEESKAAEPAMKFRSLESKDPFRVWFLEPKPEEPHLLQIAGKLEKGGKVWAVDLVWNKVRKRVYSCGLKDEKEEAYVSTDTYSDQCKITAEGTADGNVQLAFQWRGIKNEKTGELIAARGTMLAKENEAMRLRYPLGLEPDIDEDDYLVRSVYKMDLFPDILVIDAESVEHGADEQVSFQWDKKRGEWQQCGYWEKDKKNHLSNPYDKQCQAKPELKSKTEPRVVFDFEMNVRNLGSGLIVNKSGKMHAIGEAARQFNALM